MEYKARKLISRDQRQEVKGKESAKTLTRLFLSLGFTHFLISNPTIPKGKQIRFHSTLDQKRIRGKAIKYISHVISSFRNIVRSQMALAPATTGFISLLKKKTTMKESIQYGSWGWEQESLWQKISSRIEFKESIFHRSSFFILNKSGKYILKGVLIESQTNIFTTLR